ncbi:hypothetical protein HOS99_gp164 [Staphylococcus phage phiSA_BS1]|uniref:Uncharacterized protein n=2 Tax=Baoshanvirus TaxID=2732969 RepID=A0A2P1MXU9_9CAUD|nr:hypothetical protein HOS99_gp164 [Staphylococcus phage phiSA_BS1]YP_009799891.1 hypothetical protein HOT02_gp050 [Staphylococcus phage phiSA_BS2]AVP40401.1 hypothetical protein [Staphylococcus phage phiSA_BS1]AVR55495.1 hypothetical protein phiSABS2_50 [Staphylococcus phage phiSA_BS2]WFG34086.1 hypothetical protein F10086_164 [Staphylococcus phage vB_SauM_JDF86]
MSTLKEICKEQTEMIDEMRQNIRELTKESEQYKLQRDTLTEDLTRYKEKAERLEHENVRLTRLTRKLTIHRTMWDKLKDWRRDMLEIDKNDTQLISLGLIMDELEKRHLYKEDE